MELGADRKAARLALIGNSRGATCHVARRGASTISGDLGQGVRRLISIRLSQHQMTQREDHLRTSKGAGCDGAGRTGRVAYVAANPEPQAGRQREDGIPRRRIDRIAGDVLQSLELWNRRDAEIGA
jgi:hypothetical protein